MIKNVDELKKLEYKDIKQSHISYSDAMKIFEALWKEAIVLGALPLKDPLDGIETDIKMAKILNSCLKS